MKKYLQKKLNNEKGMTLIELLAVIVIIAIIAAIAIPAISTIIENSRHGAVKADYQNALAAANLHFTENPSDDIADFTELSVYLDDPGSLLDVSVTKVANGNTIDGTAEANENYYDVDDSPTNAELSDLSNAEFGTNYPGTAPVTPVN